MNIIPDEFWEPVKVTVDIKDMKFKYKIFKCPVCCQNRRKILLTNCCDGEICKKCAVKWYTECHVTCPFCRRDFRVCTNEYTVEDSKQNSFESHPLP